MRGALNAPRLDPRARRELLDAGFVSGTDTLLVGVHQTEQGTIVRIDRATGRTRTVNHSLARFSEESDMVTDPEEFSESSASHLVSEEVLLHREPDGGIEAAQSNMSHG